MKDTLTIKPFYSKEHKKIVPFLRNFDPNTEVASWERLLTYTWENQIGYQGYVMEKGQEIVGFLSYVISQQKFGNKSFNVCNISTWVVKNEYRTKSIQLLSNVFKIPNVLVLNLSPHVNTLSIFKALRFEVLSEFEYRINPIKVLLEKKTASNKKIKFEIINKNNSESLSPDAKKIIEEHREYNNIHFYKLVNEDFVNKELILGFNQKKTIVKGLKNNLKESPYKLLGRKIQLELFYCSEINDLKLHFEKIILSITKNLNYRSLIISEHFLRKTEPEYKFLSKYKKPCDWYYYTENEIDPALINLLYSEKVLLNF